MNRQRTKHLDVFNPNVFEEKWIFTCTIQVNPALTALLCAKMLVLLLACASGSLYHPEGSDPLQTALVRERPTDGRTTFLLSNSRIPCDLTTDEDPQVRAQQLLEITTAACREGARHILVNLYTSPDLAMEGLYPIVPDADLVAAIASEGRLATARLIEVREAALVSQEGLARQYTVEDLLDLHAGYGSVDITSYNRRVSGRFSVPEALTDGSFRAEICPEQSLVFDLIEVAPLTSCP